MQVITLYKFQRADGGVTISPAKPNCEYTEAVRLIADEGKALTKDGENLTTCVDTDTAEGWYEVDAPEEEQPEEPQIDPDEATTEDYIEALKELGVSE